MEILPTSLSPHRSWGRALELCTPLSTSVRAKWSTTSPLCATGKSCRKAINDDKSQKQMPRALSCAPTPLPCCTTPPLRECSEVLCSAIVPCSTANGAATPPPATSQGAAACAGGWQPPRQHGPPPHPPLSASSYTARKGGVGALPPPMARLPLPGMAGTPPPPAPGMLAGNFGGVRCSCSSRLGFLIFTCGQGKGSDSNCVYDGR